MVPKDWKWIALPDVENSGSYIVVESKTGTIMAEVPETNPAAVDTAALISIMPDLLRASSLSTLAIKDICRYVRGRPSATAAEVIPLLEMVLYPYEDAFALGPAELWQASNN